MAHWETSGLFCCAKKELNILRRGGVPEAERVLVEWMKEEHKTNPLPVDGQFGNGRPKKSRFDIVKPTLGGNDTDYTLRRLARDAPEFLDRIQSGELSVNAAAIAAGIRKKPSQSEFCVKAI